MDWQAILKSPLATWVPVLILVIFILLIFRLQVGRLIDNLTKFVFKAGKHIEVSLETSRSKQGPNQKSSLLAEIEKSSGISFIPSKTYRHLIGRQTQLNTVIAALRDPEKKMIAITGLGGIGKSALASEVVEYGRAEGVFDGFVWVSGKTEYFSGEHTQKASVPDLTFDSVLEDVGRQSNRADILRMRQDERQAAVRTLLSTKKVLIVVDNLDTVPESDALVSNLFAILGQSKALFTSRHRLNHDQVYTVSLGGLSVEAGREFLQDEAQARNIGGVVAASTTKLNKIHKVTDGAPLAMKLVVGQMSRQPMETVLDVLERAVLEGQDYEFYSFVYRHSWELLDMDARKALVGMSVFPPVTGGAVEDVKASITSNAREDEEVTLLESSSFEPAMNELVTMSLVDMTGSAGRERYALHPLTQYFVKSDITKEWTDYDG